MWIETSSGNLFDLKRVSVINKQYISDGSGGGYWVAKVNSQIVEYFATARAANLFLNKLAEKLEAETIDD